MRPFFVLSLVVAACAGALADQAFTPSVPTQIVSLSGGSFKGNPSQLAWSPDSKTLCVQTLEGDTAPLKMRYYVVSIDERTFHGADIAPDWVAGYWAFKTSRTPPGHPELQIEVETKNQGTGVPTQSLSDKAKNGMMDNAVAAQNAAGSVVRVLKLKGEVIGRYDNQPLVPGMTFGWSPEALHAVAYAQPGGHLGVLDLNASQIEVPGTKDVLLPAWSPDGTRIVYLQKTGRHDYAVMSVGVTLQ